MIHHIYTGSAVKEIDSIAIQQYDYKGFELMTLAGEKAFHRIAQRFSKPASMLVLCGSGNNGGDGYITAASALEAGWKVNLIACGEPKSADACSAAERFLSAGGVSASVDELADEADYQVVVDALLGVGIEGAPRDEFAKLIDKANALSAYKFAVDVPSGINADTGAAYTPCFQADETMTYIAPKLGLMTGPAVDFVGELSIEDLGVSQKVRSQISACASLLEAPKAHARPRDSHKGSFGHVVIAGGDNGMLGAALLAGRAALRSGSGKVHILSTDQHLDQAALSTPELMSAVFEEQNLKLAKSADALAIGPGLGLNDWGKRVFNGLIELDKPMVIDADSLSLLAGTAQGSRNANWVLTPHPGEAARLLQCSTTEIQDNRRAAALEIARQRNAVCVLKGAGTLVAAPSGEVALCDRGNPGMATAGMGDVLTGIVAAYLGLGWSPFEAAKAAVWLHSATADYCAQQTSETTLLASDVVEHLYCSLA